MAEDRRKSGISNRKSAAEESRERAEHPPVVDADSPPPEDASGRVGEQPLSDMRDRHTSHKAGSRSIAQKEAGSRYPDRSMPPSRKVAGAFGSEPRLPTRSVGSAPAASNTDEAAEEASMAKYGRSASKNVESTMRRRKRGTLKSGSGRKVKSRKQAIAIGLSEARRKGAKVPAPGSRRRGRGSRGKKR
jgi:hypothetical protein